ncbi:NUDIX domain-containing protein [Bordetella hinzii]|nr:NUDIX domain-containing protein [Bordetella hinzii]
MWIDDKGFRQVLALTPLVSIDLLIQNSIGDVLLGRRQNRPALGSWFVPGGRVRKGERLAETFTRLVRDEVNAVGDMKDARFLGVFEHFYDDNTFGDRDSGTHYVALAYSLRLSNGIDQIASDGQHSSLMWWPVDMAKADPTVHPYTKAYLEGL